MTTEEAVAILTGADVRGPSLAWVLTVRESYRKAGGERDATVAGVLTELLLRYGGKPGGAPVDWGRVAAAIVEAVVSREEFKPEDLLTGEE